MSILAIDSGNSRIKWGWHDAQHWVHQGAAPQADIAALQQQWKSLPLPSQIIVSNVAGEQVGAALATMLLHWPVHARWITSTAFQCGVRNYYSNPAQLGTDRWAALIAVWTRQQQACLVVNAGTAMTIDALSDTGEFLGGIIVPGLKIMCQTLQENTAALALDKGEFHEYPDNSADAVYSGALQAMTGAVERMARTLATSLGHTPLCILSGGSAHAIKSRLPLEAQIIESLVLDGLVAIASGQNKI